MFLQKYWNDNHDNYDQGMLFVPDNEDVKKAMDILKFWGGTLLLCCF
jgi:hypothetical protein